MRLNISQKILYIAVKFLCLLPFIFSIFCAIILIYALHILFVTDPYKGKGGKKMKDNVDIRMVVGITGLYLAIGFSLASPIDFDPIIHPIKVEAHAIEPYYCSSTSQQPVVKTSEMERPYTDEELELLAHVINAEQGIEFDDETKTNKLQIYTGQVVLNRLKKHYLGAKTLEDVIYSDSQYACVSDVSWTNPISERAYKNAKILLLGLDYSKILGIRKMPDNVIYQAEFPQSSKPNIDPNDNVWDHIDDTYFCYE